MSYTKDDNRKAVNYLTDNGYTKQQNGSGYQNGNTVVKQQGNSWITNNGDRFSTLSDLKKSNKV